MRWSISNGQWAAAAFDIVSATSSVSPGVRRPRPLSGVRCQSASEREAVRRVSKRSRNSLLKVLDPDVPTAEPPDRARSIALGIERLALIPFKAPTATVLAALAIAVLAILGIHRIKTDDSLSQLFRSEDPAFQQFEQISRDFPSSEYDVLIVVS